VGREHELAEVAGMVANEPRVRAISPASLAIAWNVVFMAPPTLRTGGPVTIHNGRGDRKRG